MSSTQHNNPTGNNLSKSSENQSSQQVQAAQSTHFIKKQKYHGKANYQNNHILRRILRGLILKKEVKLPPKRTLNPPALDQVPESILDEIRMHNVQTEQQLRKARLRQALFLNKRRKTKHKKRLASQSKVMGRLFLTFTLLGLWMWLLQAPVWTITASNINVWVPNPENSFIQNETPFTNTQEIKQFVSSKIENKPIYQLATKPLEKDLKKKFQTLAHAEVRRSLFPNSIEVAIIEKPVWASIYRLNSSDTSSLDELKNRWNNLLPNSSGQINTRLISFQQVGLLHPEGELSVFKTQDLTTEQRIHLQHIVPIYTQKRFLTSRERHTLQRITEVWKKQEALFLRFDSTLLMIDARDPDNVFAIFKGFKAHIGELDSQALKRSARLGNLLNIISQYTKSLDWVELAWNQQVTLKLKSAVNVTTGPSI